MRRPFLDELSGTLALAVPVAVGQLGMMLMSLVDTAMVSKLGPAAIAAVGVGTSIHGVVFLFGLGLLMGLDRVVAFAHGRGEVREVKRSLVQGTWLALVASVPMTALLVLAAGHLDLLGIAPAIRPGAAVYLRTIAWSIAPTLVFSAIRQGLQGIDDTRMATGLSLLANVVNLAGNRLLIYGGLGLAPLGVVGSAYSTLASRLFLCVALAVHAFAKLRHLEARRSPDPAMLEQLVRLGLPAGIQLVFEGGVFSLVTVLMARIGPVPAAAHQIVLQIASFTFMVPLGIASAGSVRVGQALGRGDGVAARRAGWLAVGLGMSFMILSGATLLVLSHGIVGLFPEPEAVHALASKLLVVAGVFQIADGAQVTLAGVLRGANETLSSMLANLAGHWCVGLPTGALLCYVVGLGPVGLWIGLALGLACVAATLAFVWNRRMAAHVATAVEA